MTNAFIRIMPNFADAKWLDDNHRVAKKPRKYDKPAPHTEFVTGAIAEYAAASVPLHLADAWTYFGRALAALAAGAVDVAQHLLYYCELRAMDALLFRHGVVLMNGTNFAVAEPVTKHIPFPSDSRGIESNSHQAIWVLFNQWVKTPVGAKFCGDTILLGGQPLSRWANDRPLPVPLSTAMQPLMQLWGVDMKRFSRDRQLRNEGSYNPTRLRTVETGVTPDFVAHLYEQVWQLLEPDQQNAFQSLDRFITRSAFDLFAGNDPNPETDGAINVPDHYPTMNAFWVDTTLGQGRGGFITEFLDDPVATPTPRILDDAKEDLKAGSLAEQFSGMTGRALVLLRFATGAVRDLLVDAGCSGAQIEFWLTDMLSVHGIRTPEDNIYIDLWPEVEDAVEDIGQIRGNGDAADIAIIREQLANQFSTLSGFERVPAWAVA